MANVFAGAAQTARIEVGGDVFVFDLTTVQSLSAIGVDQRLFDATSMLGRAITLKPLVRSGYEEAKMNAHRRYWAMAATGERAKLFLLDEKQKPTQTHFMEFWLDQDREYINFREMREYLDDVIQSLQMVYIPRLRTLSEGAHIGERQQTQGRPGSAYPEPFDWKGGSATHAPLPQVPPAPPTPFTGTLEGCR